MNTNRSMHFLLVDDDEEDFIMDREMVRDAFGERAVLDWSSSFDDGLRRAADKTYDIIFINYRLGTRDGIDLLREIGRLSPNSALVMSTSWPFDPHFIDEAMSNGASAVLRKADITPEKLASAVEEVLGPRNGQSSHAQ